MASRAQASKSLTLTDTQTLSLTALPGIPLVTEGDDLVTLILQALNRTGLTLQNRDALVISSKIVSKAEGRLVDLKTITPGPQAERLAEITRKDPRIVEVVLSESSEISRTAPGVLVTRHRLGFVSANAGIDQSNTGGGPDEVLLLPADPDATADHIRTALKTQAGADVAVVISDSHGRPFRMGNIGAALGVSGMPALVDLRGQRDLYGRELKISLQGYADLVASAAHLVCGEGDEGLPVILARGLRFNAPPGRAADLNRPPENDLYR